MGRATMLDFLGNGDERFQQAHNGILAAIEEVIAHGPKTPDMKGNATRHRLPTRLAKLFCVKVKPVYLNWRHDVVFLFVLCSK
ncbi:hypothetical protein ACLK1T_25525 [Escherichia coli]